jgi:hypothetical protein
MIYLLIILQFKWLKYSKGNRTINNINILEYILLKKFNIAELLNLFGFTLYRGTIRECIELLGYIIDMGPLSIQDKERNKYLSGQSRELLIQTASRLNITSNLLLHNLTKEALLYIILSKSIPEVFTPYLRTNNYHYTDNLKPLEVYYLAMYHNTRYYEHPYSFMYTEQPLIMDPFCIILGDQFIDNPKIVDEIAKRIQVIFPSSEYDVIQQLHYILDNLYDYSLVFERPIGLPKTPSFNKTDDSSTIIDKLSQYTDIELFILYSKILKPDSQWISRKTFLVKIAIIIQKRIK